MTYSLKNTGAEWGQKFLLGLLDCSPLFPTVSKIDPVSQDRAEQVWAQRCVLWDHPVYYVLKDCIWVHSLVREKKKPAVLVYFGVTCSVRAGEETQCLAHGKQVSTTKLHTPAPGLFEARPQALANLLYGRCTHFSHRFSPFEDLLHLHLQQVLVSFSDLPRHFPFQSGNASSHLLRRSPGLHQVGNTGGVWLWTHHEHGSRQEAKCPLGLLPFGILTFSLLWPNTWQ